ncbi:MAG TPA: universal stress protein [bacterium]|nr:universal stress protein [bacterium]
MFPFIYRLWRYSGLPEDLTTSTVTRLGEIQPAKPLPALGMETEQILQGALLNPFHLSPLWQRPSHGIDGIEARPEKILVADDGSEASAAAARDAGFLADHYGCKTISSTVARGPVTKILLETAIREGCDMIAVGTQARPLQDRIHHPSISEQLVKESASPVWISRAGPTGSLRGKLERILVPMDDTPQAWRAASQALIFARDFGADLFLLHVARKGQEPSGQVEGRHALLEKIPWKRTQTLEVAQRADLADTIAGEAESQDADLILMGTHRAETEAAVMDFSRTSRVVRVARRPLLVVHP